MPDRFERTIVINPPGSTVMVTVPELELSVVKLLDYRVSAIQDFSEPLDKFGDFLVKVHITAQIVYQSGTPEKFAPLSPAYRERKERLAPGMPILVFSGEMLQQFDYEVDGNQLTLTNDKAYAEYHLTGTSRMPARKWLQLKEDELGWRKFRDLVKEHVLEFKRL